MSRVTQEISTRKGVIPVPRHWFPSKTAVPPFIPVRDTGISFRNFIV
ncbi:splicing factor 3B subunit 2 [Wolbachia endosymbiont of Aedes albopictus]|nr:splicing factor 3B subunit 2 [Wolbachia endosymbiont of Aedes albopictus]